MRTTHKAKLRSRIRILPDNRIVIFDPFKLGVVNNVNLGVLGDQAFARLYGFGGQTVDVIQAYDGVIRTVSLGIAASMAAVILAVIWLFGGTGALLARIVYTVIALAGIWCISLLFRDEDELTAADSLPKRYLAPA